MRGGVRERHTANGSDNPGPKKGGAQISRTGSSIQIEGTYLHMWKVPRILVEISN